MSTFNFFEPNPNQIVEYFHAGEYIFHNGTPSYGAFGICKGSVELITKNDEGFFLKEIKKSGDIIGEDNLDIHYFIYDALALEDTEVIFYDKNFIIDVLEPDDDTDEEPYEDDDE